MKFKNHIVPLIYDDYIVMVYRKEQNHKKQKKNKKKRQTKRKKSKKKKFKSKKQNKTKENKRKQTNKPKQSKKLKICLEFMNHHCVFILILFWCKCNDNDISQK